MSLLIRFDPEVDVVYVSFRERAPADVSVTRQLDERRLLDLDAAGAPLGIEFLYASEGIDLSDVPEADEVRRALTAFQSLSAA